MLFWCGNLCLKWLEDGEEERAMEGEGGPFFQTCSNISTSELTCWTSRTSLELSEILRCRELCPLGDVSSAGWLPF